MLVHVSLTDAVWDHADGPHVSRDRHQYVAGLRPSPIPFRAFGGSYPLNVREVEVNAIT